MLRSLLILVATLASACDGRIYVRDGVTDGDTFYLAERALTDDDPVLQSWVTYSLARSTCQLQVGGENPARVSTYGCEFSARLLLTDSWAERRPAEGDAYLDALVSVREEGFLDEYVAHYFARRDWQIPAEVDSDAFDAWRRRHLRGHRPVTRIIGSWNYADPARRIAGGEH